MTRVPRAVLIAAVTATLALFVFPSTAYADNCGSLYDCYGTAQAALAALVGLSVLFGVLLSLALDLLPGIGTIKGIIESITGRDLITGEELAWWERALGFAPVLRRLGQGAAMVGKLDGFADGAGIGGMGMTIPGIGRGPGPGRYTPPLPPLDRRTANTGGIRDIYQPLPDVNGARTVVIEGRIQRSIPDRRGNAPNFNEERHWRNLRDELGVPDYQAAHLWGPGFGDEAAAGIMLAPPQANQGMQAAAEHYIRELGALANAAGGEVRVTASATSHGSNVRGGDALLAEMNYDIAVVDRAGNVIDGKRVNMTVDPPPSGRPQIEVTNLPPRRY